jgi:hypothetical protein
MSQDELRAEAQALLRVAGSALEAYHMLERQLSVLVMRTQVLLSLSGIVITVTGFSGRAIAQTSALARASIAAGIVVVLAAAVVAIAGVLRLRWLSEIVVDDPLETVVRGLELRNRKSRFLAAALVLFVIGFGFYVLAIAQLLLDTPIARD